MALKDWKKITEITTLIEWKRKGYKGLKLVAVKKYPSLTWDVYTTVEGDIFEYYGDFIENDLTKSKALRVAKKFMETH